MRAAWYEKQGAARDALVVGERPDAGPGLGEVRWERTLPAGGVSIGEKRPLWRGARAGEWSRVARAGSGLTESRGRGKLGGALMQFAIFGSAQAASERPGAAPGEGFHEFVELSVEAEALGYRATFLVEHQ